MDPDTATRLTSVALETRIAMLLTALFSNRIQTLVMPGPPSFSWLFTSCFQPAAWYSSFTELKASGSYIQGEGKWKLWTETPLTPAITRRRSSLSGSSLDANTSMEWSSVNSVFEDAPCRRAAIPCGIQSCCCCAPINGPVEMAINTTKTIRDSLIERLHLGRNGLDEILSQPRSRQNPRQVRTPRIRISCTTAPTAPSNSIRRH